MISRARPGTRRYLQHATVGLYPPRTHSATQVGLSPTTGTATHTAATLLSVPATQSCTHWPNDRRTPAFYYPDVKARATDNASQTSYQSS